jgi:hypothetical protein
MKTIVAYYQDELLPVAVELTIRLVRLFVLVIENKLSFVAVHHLYTFGS